MNAKHVSEGYHRANDQSPHCYCRFGQSRDARSESTRSKDPAVLPGKVPGMEIEPVQQVLESEGFAAPKLNALTPNVDNYKLLLMQPKGNIEASAAGVRNFDRSLAQVQFGQLLSDALATQADLVVTPEYAMPWQILIDAIKAGQTPAAGKLWALGCESIKYSELDALKADLAPHATVVHEPLDPDPNRFLDPLAYVFIAPPLEGDGAPSPVVLVQFKTHPMGDADHFEINGLQRGTCVYQFGGTAGQDIKLVSLICSDAFAFLDDQAQAVYDRGLVLHIQLNPKPRQEQFRLYRDRLLRFQGDATELICLNWAADVHQQSNGTEISWGNIAGSAWYLKPDKFDCRDDTLHTNHKRGLYYTWLKPLYVHALFFNYEPATYVLEATKVAHVGVPAAVSRRRGPQLTKTCIWNNGTASWTKQDNAQDGFSAVADEAGNAKHDIKRISDERPLAAERVLALCAGCVGNTDDWHTVRRLDSCAIDAPEIIFRLTFCQDTDHSACNFRTARLKRCGHLWDILNTGDALPPALQDFKSGFRLDWLPAFPHQNAISNQGSRATAVYMGEDCNVTQVEATAKRLDEFLHRASSDPDQSLEARQRLAVWYRDDNRNLVAHSVHIYTQIDKTGDQSEFDIGRAE